MVVGLARSQRSRWLSQARLDFCHIGTLTRLVRVARSSEPNSTVPEDESKAFIHGHGRFPKRMPSAAES